jgi:hypothetical protein
MRGTDRPSREYVATCVRLPPWLPGRPALHAPAYLTATTNADPSRRAPNIEDFPGINCSIQWFFSTCSMYSAANGKNQYGFFRANTVFGGHRSFIATNGSQ